MLCDYTAGWISGVVSLLIGHPLDTIKIQQQVRGISFTEAAKRIQKHRGYKGYYRGLLVPLLSTGALNAIFFGVYGDIRDYLIDSRLRKEGFWGSVYNHDIHRPHHRKSMKIPIIGELYNDDNNDIENHNLEEEATFAEMFLASGVASTISLLFATPVELVKTKLQSQMRRKMFTGPADCFVTVFKEAGFRGIYRGMLPMLTRNVIGSIINYFVLCKVLDLCNPGLFPTSPDQVLFAHAAGGCAAWAFVMPLDVVKSRMQADHHCRPMYRGAVHCFKEIYKHEGVIGLYRGFWPCVARAFPVNAAIFLVYEYVQKELCKNDEYMSKLTKLRRQEVEDSFDDKKTK